MAHDPQLTLTDVQWVLGHAHLTTTQLYVTPSPGRGRAGGAGSPRPPARRRDDPPPPAPGYDPRSLAVLFGQDLMSRQAHRLARRRPWRTRPARRRRRATVRSAPGFPRVRSRRAGRRPRARWRTRRDGWPARRFLPPSHATRAGRRHGVIKLLRWLSTFPGESWQQRWLTSGVEEHSGRGLGAAAAGLARRARPAHRRVRLIGCPPAC